MIVAAAKKKYEEDEARGKLEDYRAGTVAAAVFTAMGVQPESGSKKRWAPADFFASLTQEPDEEPDEDKETLAHMAAMKGWVELFGKPRREIGT